MSQARSPRCLWDFCGQLVAAYQHKTVHNYPSLDGLTPEEWIHARSPDISAYAQFE
jgi:hypothetical protein